jgi:hypothetical protein
LADAPEEAAAAITKDGASSGVIRVPRSRADMRRPVDKVIDALGARDLRVKAAWGNTTTKEQTWMAQCPAHEDGEPSLSIREGDDGRALLNCFASCHVTAVCDALGLSLSDLFMSDEVAAAWGLQYGR